MALVTLQTIFQDAFPAYEQTHPLWRDGIAVQPSREMQSCSPVLPENPLYYISTLSVSLGVAVAL
jgi:hypothetical protein